MKKRYVWISITIFVLLIFFVAQVFLRQQKKADAASEYSNTGTAAIKKEVITHEEAVKPSQPPMAPCSEAEENGAVLKKERTAYFDRNGAASAEFDSEGTVLVQRLMEDGSLYIYKWHKGEWTWEIQTR